MLLNKPNLLLYIIELQHRHPEKENLEFEVETQDHPHPAILNGYLSL